MYCLEILPWKQCELMQSQAAHRATVPRRVASNFVYLLLEAFLTVCKICPALWLLTAEEKAVEVFYSPTFLLLLTLYGKSWRRNVEMNRESVLKGERSKVICLILTCWYITKPVHNCTSFHAVQRL